MRIEWCPSVPDEARNALEPILHKWEWLMPTWVHELTINVSDESDIELSSFTEPEYRRAVIYIHLLWLQQDSATRERDLVHELLHIPLAHICDFAQMLIKKTLEPDAPIFQSWAEEQLRYAKESCVCDLQNALTDMR